MANRLMEAFVEIKAQDNMAAGLAGVGQHVDRELDKVEKKAAATAGKLRIQGAREMSYAVQDFAVGLAGGGFQQAMIGASNNLSMLAMQISPLAGALVGIGAVVLPGLVSGIEKWVTGEEKAIDKTNRLADSLRDLHSVYERIREFREAGEPSDAKTAGAANDAIVREEKNLRKMQAALKDVDKERQDVNSRLLPTVLDTRVDAFQAKKIREEEASIREGNPDDPLIKKRIQALAERKRKIAEASGTGADTIAVEGDNISFLKLATAKELEDVNKRLAELDKQHDDDATKIAAKEREIGKLRERKAELAKTELAVLKQQLQAQSDLEEKLAKINKNAEATRKHILEVTEPGAKRKELLADLDADTIREQQRAIREDRFKEDELKLRLSPNAYRLDTEKLRIRKEFESEMEGIQKRFPGAQGAGMRGAFEGMARNKRDLDLKRAEEDDASRRRHFESGMIRDIAGPGGGRTQEIMEQFRTRQRDIDRNFGGNAEMSRQNEAAIKARTKLLLLELKNEAPKGELTSIQGYLDKLNTAGVSSDLKAWQEAMRKAEESAAKSLEVILKDGINLKGVLK